MKGLCVWKLACACLLLAWVGCCMASATSDTGGPLPQEQIDALVDLYHSTNGDNWKRNANWLEGDPCENQWYGVLCCEVYSNYGYVCDEYGTDVTTLSLDNNEVGGTIPASVDALPLLRFDMRNNHINGTLPGSIGNMQTLLELDFAGNNFWGKIPKEITNLTDINYLDLSFNAFTGEIPSDIGNMQQLTALNLYSNQLSGTIPTSIVHLKEMISMGMWGNQLSGTIPEVFCGMNQLHDLNMDNNFFYGPVPTSLISCCVPQLELLSITDNYLTSMPPALEDGVENVFYEVNLSQNCFKPPLPAWCNSQFCNDRPRQECHDFFCGMLPDLPPRQAESMATTWNCINATSPTGLPGTVANAL